MTARIKILPGRRPRRPSPVERLVGFLLVAVLAGAVVVFLAAGARPGPAAPTPPPASTSLLPLKTPGGWPRGEVESYNEETLFEKINGKADAYFAYEFARLEFASYARPDDPAQFVDVYLYDMTRPLYALGIYRTQRSGKELRLSLEEESCAAGASAFGRKGRYYVEVMASGPGAAPEAGAALAAVLSRLPAPEASTGDPPWLPREGLRSVRFVRENCLMVESLREAWLATYSDGTMIVVASGGDAEKEDAEETLEMLGTPVRFVISGDRLLGVVGTDDPKRLREVLTLLEKAR